MTSIDCFLVGHNELPIEKSKRMLSYMYGTQSHEYRDRAKYNLSQVLANKRRYSPAAVFNTVQRARGRTDDLGIITESFNLAIACLGSQLHRRELTFDFVNSFQDDRAHFETCLRTTTVRTVAIITTYYLSPIPIREIVAFVRRLSPETRIIIGGPYVLNRLQGLAPDKITELFDAIGGDYYVRDSFGEELLADIVAQVRSGREPTLVRNVYTRRGDHFSCARLEVRAYDFADHPVDWSLFGGRLTNVVNLRTAVSCPYKCSFCNFPAYAGKYTLAPLEACERELRDLRERGIRNLQFVDDTFNVPKPRFKELLQMMIRNEFGFRWNSYFKSQYVDAEVVALMKAAGCEFVFLGIESGSQSVLDNMNKGTTVESYRACIELFRQHDIMTMCSLIVGFPGETTDTLAETQQFLDDARPTFYQQRLWWYDRTTPIHQQRERFGIEGEGYTWRHASMTSDEAHEHADRLFFDVESAIHITEYALPFFLESRGVDRPGVLGFLRHYMTANRAQYRHPDREADASALDGMCRALGSTAEVLLQ